MRRAPLLAILALLSSAPAQAESDFPPAISVTGEASISVPPDLASVDAGVATEAKTAREASEANNTAMTKVVAALKSANIDPKDIRTSQLSLQPQYASSSSSRLPGPSTIVGYRASNRVTVRIRDVTKVASVIDTLVGAGANDIGNIAFEVSQASKLLDDAREKAVADARRKAEIYARAAGVALGQPLSIAESGAPQPVFHAKMMRSNAPMATTPAPIEQGEETLSVSVAVTWQIKQGQ
jgi:uncharacterized protein YggE